MRHAAACFHPGIPTPVIGGYTPRGPEGGIYGGALLVTVLTDYGCGCGTNWATLPGLDDAFDPLPGDPRA
jgi:hypothetical protein